MALNAVGDREIADFDFWAVREKEDAFIWKKDAIYDGHSEAAINLG